MSTKLIANPHLSSSLRASSTVGHSPQATTVQQRTTGEKPKMLSGLNSPASNLGEKTSYCFNTMSRIETMRNAIMQTEKLVNKTKESVELELGKMLKNGSVAVDLQKLNIKIRMLREQLDKERAELELLKRKSLSFGKANSSSQLSNCASVSNNLSHLSNHLNHRSAEHDVRALRNSLSHQSTNSLSHSSSYNLPNSLPNHLTESLLSNCVHQQLTNLTNSTSNLPNSSLSNRPISLLSANSHSPIARSVDGLFDGHDDEERPPVQFDPDQLERDRKLLSKIESELLMKSDLLKQINESLLFTERKLISELYEIFPIEESPDGLYTILGLQLPDLTEPVDEHNDQIKISLGYCCQLLITIGKVFDIPLKHEILFSGSQSWIVNETENPRLKDKKYPLFPNRDKSKFTVAIYLLNENIAQIAHHFKLPTDQKKLSSNLFNLFHDKLLLKPEKLDGA